MFEFNAKTHLVINRNLVEALKPHRFGSRVGLIIDVALSEHEQVKALLKELGTDVVVEYYFKAQEPTTSQVDSVVELFRAQMPVDQIIGIGGGSTLDLTKAVSAMALREDSVEGIHAQGIALQTGIPSILVPTTAGTGSEVTPGAVLVNEKTQYKRAVSGPGVGAQVAVLCAPLVQGCPKFISATIGLDALAHAVESYTAKCSNVVTKMYSKRAFELLVQAIPRLLKDNNDIDAHEQALIGSALAGYAIYNANTGACHAMAYPLGIYHHVPHGLAVGLLLPKVVQINMSKGCADLYNELFGSNPVEFLEKFTAYEFIDKSLEDYGIGEDQVDFLAQRGLDLKPALSNNPVDFTLEDTQNVLESLVATSFVPADPVS